MDIERVFEAPEADLFATNDNVDAHYRRMVAWFQDWCCTPPAPHYARQPHVKHAAKERVRIVSSILRCTCPEQALYWGLRGDNDNNPENNIA